MKVDPQAFLQKGVWGMPCAETKVSVPTSAEGLAKMMTVIAIVFEAARPAVSKATAETMPARTSN